MNELCYGCWRFSIWQQPATQKTSETYEDGSSMTWYWCDYHAPLNAVSLCDEPIMLEAKDAATS